MQTTGADERNGITIRVHLPCSMIHDIPVHLVIASNQTNPEFPCQPNKRTAPSAGASGNHTLSASLWRHSAYQRMLSKETSAPTAPWASMDGIDLPCW